jgi:hypothetical protein
MRALMRSNQNDEEATTMKYTKEDEKYARMHLDHVKPGDTLYTTVTHVARSGMSRSIKLFVMENGAPMERSWAASRLLGYSLDEKHGGVKIGGCGMDMGFHLVYTLSRALFRDGFKCVGENCPANDHNNPGREKFRKGSKHTDAGYALKQRWL